MRSGRLRATHLVTQNRFTSNGRIEILWTIYRRGCKNYSVHTYRGFADTERSNRITRVLNRYLVNSVTEVVNARDAECDYVVWFLPRITSVRNIRHIIPGSTTWGRTTVFEIENPFRINREEHSDSCLTAFYKWRDTVFAFARKFPLHCRNCGGTGGFVSHFNPDPSSGPGYLEDYETCSHCVDQNLCPRCGKELVQEEDSSHCSDCMWMDKAENYGIPVDSYECDCWYSRFRVER